jgi:riboflavin kinase / FMN adenylyltransferase
MKIIKGLRNRAAFPGSSCLTLGTFDGVHLGHQKVIRTTVCRAAEMGLTSVVMTFSRHPRETLRNGAGPPLLTATEHKLALIEQLAVDVSVLLELDEQLASMSASDFVSDVICGRLRAACVIAGARLRFGKDREGNPRLLKKLGRQLGFAVESVKELRVGGVPVSSTAVRQHVLHGRLALAESLLGRKFSILGRVVRGRSVGRRLGYCTANIRPLDQVIPPSGVYVAEVLVAGGRHPGALNIGWRPTFPGRRPGSATLEVHIINFDTEIYGEGVELIFHRRIRDEKRFSDPKQLMAQIALDIDEVKGYFRNCRKTNALKEPRPRQTLLARGVKRVD